MMNLFFLFLLLALPVCGTRLSSGAAFGKRDAVFGIRAGADTPSGKESDYERAQRVIFNGIERVEKSMQKAVEDEVHLMFDDTDHKHKDKVTENAKAAVSKGADRIKSTARDHSKARNVPFLPKHAEEVEQEDHRLLHALEAAEKAVVQAVQEEVENIFHTGKPHDDEHHPLKEVSSKTVKKAKASVKTGVEKVKKTVEDDHDDRKKWMEGLDQHSIDDFMAGWE